MLSPLATVIGNQLLELYPQTLTFLSSFKNTNIYHFEQTFSYFLYFSTILGQFFLYEELKKKCTL